ncbi:zinc-dependent alcohol dehydrogenase [Bacillus sp. Marseille-P3661]|uniref:zinc-dependent alcohol dehydrogenase n=1 Tax=Bacillus sp. Marseille-P3661 TaxID=1936234 RepID=UPI000C842E81|nr:zinc-binding dehydrogenase [Bacillus sp. Marseille-P3661]
MKAIVKSKYGVGNVEYIDMPIPDPGPYDIKVEVYYTGICGTDMHIYHDTFKYNPPVIMGHEFSGVVVEVGDKVTRFKIGDQVTGEAPAKLCGKCRYCRSGEYNLCSDRLGIGWGVNGSFAKFCIVEESMAHLLPSNLELRAAALCEPLACVTHGVMDLTKVSATELVVVSGPGAIGLLTMQVAKAEGARVVVCGTSYDEERLGLAAKLGADLTIDVMREDSLKIIKEITNGYGADIVFECSGAQQSLTNCLDLIRKGGQFTQVGLYGKPIEVDFEKITTKELKVTGVQSQNKSGWEKTLNLLERGLVDLEPLISHEMGLSEWQEAFHIIERKEGLKVVLRPEE